MNITAVAAATEDWPNIPQRPRLESYLTLKMSTSLPPHTSMPVIEFPANHVSEDTELIISYRKIKKHIEYLSSSTGE